MRVQVRPKRHPKVAQETRRAAKQQSKSTCTATKPKPLFFTIVQHFLKVLQALEGSLKGQVESKLRLEHILEDQMESKWRLEASLEGQMESKWRLGCGLEGQVWPKRRQEAAKSAQAGPRGSQERPRASKCGQRGIQRSPKRFAELRNSSPRALAQQQSPNLDFSRQRSTF